MSSATIQASHVHFPAELAKPPADRQRKGLDYPKVAQCKDSNVSTSDRQTSEDLYWGQRAVASPDTETDELSRLADFPAAPGRQAVAKRGLFFTFLRVLTPANLSVPPPI
ncbi:hypothetical protein EWM64_g463 [Hericium alpestre]|uniref:Uncharacterized protein n=1 Tax=Hericium alpestre TaxID=135208 RepID=A0A4Z0AB41_9AGAM|nr:hypothetical protein EWM64_g463 [Hericium alpestre]